MHEECKKEGAKACIMCRLSCSTAKEVAALIAPQLPSDREGMGASENYDLATEMLDDAIESYDAFNSVDDPDEGWRGRDINHDVHTALVDQLSSLGYARQMLTVCILKPSIDQSLYHEVTKTLSRDFQIVLRSCGALTREQVNYLYAEHIGKPYYEAHATYMSSGYSLALLLRSTAYPAVARLRVLLGSTDPRQAAHGTLRQRYGEKLPENGFHGSDSTLAVRREAQFFWSRSDLIAHEASALVDHLDY